MDEDEAGAKASGWSKLAALFTALSLLITVVTTTLLIIDSPVLDGPVGHPAPTIVPQTVVAIPPTAPSVPSRSALPASGEGPSAPLDDRVTVNEPAARTLGLTNRQWGTGGLAVAALVPLAFAFLLWRRNRRVSEVGRALEEDRLSGALTALQSASRLVEELSAEINTQSAVLLQVQEEARDFERLAALRREEAEAVTKLVSSVIGATLAEVDRRNTRNQWMFYFLGVATSIPVGVLINLWTK